MPNEPAAPQELPRTLVAMSDEQLRHLILGRDTGPSGLGAPRESPFLLRPNFREIGFGKGPRAQGSEAREEVKTLGAPYECQVDPTIAADVYMFLRLGSPRLALARAWGVPMAPYLVNCRGTFPSVSTSVLTNVDSQQKIVQDTYVDCVVGRITNLSTTANQTTLQTLSDFFYNFQNGIDVTCQVVGAPRFSIAEFPTPASTFADMFNGGSRWGNGWTLMYQQQLSMQYTPNITLPTAPLDLTFSYRSWVPTNDMFIDMTSSQAIQKLRDDGFWIPDWYANRVCR